MKPIAPALFADADTPALLLDEDQLRANIATMQARVAGTGIALRPHAKAHKSPLIAKLQREAGAVGICCAKLSEAEVMAAGGQDDILVTTPIVDPAKIRRLAALAQRIRIAVVADHEANIHALAAAASAHAAQIGVVVEVDVGQGRCGVAPGPQAALLAAAILAHAPALRFAGVQGYQGRLQNVAAWSERAAGVRLAMDALERSLAKLREAGIAVPVVTGGGSGTAPIDIGLSVLNELQPGSYVTMDRPYAATQWTEQGGLPPFGQPLLVLASVVSRPGDDRVVIDVGWKSINSDGAQPVVWQRPDLQFEFAGDEHALLRPIGQAVLDLQPGDRVLLVPGHCDTTVNLYDAFTVHRSGRLESRWEIAARGKSQ